MEIAVPCPEEAVAKTCVMSEPRIASTNLRGKRPKRNIGMLTQPAKGRNITVEEPLGPHGGGETVLGKSRLETGTTIKFSAG